MPTTKNDPRLSKRYRVVAKQVIAASGFICFYCGGVADTADHILPVSKHPELALDIMNMVACCRSCNSKKGSKPQGVFLHRQPTPPSLPDRVSPMVAQRQEDSPFQARPLAI